MASPEKTAPSKKLTQAAASEHSRLHRELQKLELRIQTLQLELDQANTDRTHTLAQLSKIEALIGSPPPQPACPTEPPAGGYLRGAQIRLAAIEVASSRDNPETPLHYTDWYQQLQAAGYAIDGRDPLATFLTQLNRSPLVTKAPPAGYYALDLSAAARLQTRLTNLHDELSRLHSGQQTINQIASTRERREQLLNEIKHTERALDEALTHHTPQATATN